MEKVKFELSNEQIQFLKNNYPKDDLVQKILSTETKGSFEVDEEPYIDFMDYLDDESVAWMDKDYNATPKSIMIEKIRDHIYIQTN